MWLPGEERTNIHIVQEHLLCITVLCISVCIVVTLYYNVLASITMLALHRLFIGLRLLALCGDNYCGGGCIVFCNFLIFFISTENTKKKY